MADGYARATGQPAFANIHIAGGLANGISGLYNAFRGGTPLVLTAGNSDTRMLISEPVLSGDLVAMTEQYTKWSVEIRHASDIPVAIRRAFKEAKTPPTGPVFISFPWDTLDEEIDFEPAASSDGYFRIRPDAAAIARATELLAGAENPGHHSRRPRGPVRRRVPGGAGSRTDRRPRRPPPPTPKSTSPPPTPSGAGC